MPKRTRLYRESLLEDLSDPAEASAYLNAAMEDSEEMFLVALRDVAEARQLSKVAAEVGVARESIYRMLSRSGNPTYSNLMGVLNAMGLRISVTPISGPQASGPAHESSLNIMARNSIATLAEVGCAKRRGTADKRLLPNPIVGTEMISPQMVGGR